MQTAVFRLFVDRPDDMISSLKLVDEQVFVTVTDCSTTSTTMLPNALCVFALDYTAWATCTCQAEYASGQPRGPSGACSGGLGGLDGTGRSHRASGSPFLARSIAAFSTFANTRSAEALGASW